MYEKQFLGHIQQAHYEEAIKNDPTLPDAHEGLAEIHKEQSTESDEQDHTPANTSMIPQQDYTPQSIEQDDEPANTTTEPLQDKVCVDTFLNFTCQIFIFNIIFL